MKLGPVGQLILEDETDIVLVDFAIAGNQAAFNVIVHRYQGLMHGYAMRTLDSNAESDDVVQETFIAAWEKLQTLEDGENLKTWLMRVVRNKCVDRLRKERPFTVVIDEHTPATVESSPFDVVETYRSRCQRHEQADDEHGPSRISQGNRLQRY